MIQRFLTRQLERRSVPWLLPIIACLLSAASVALVSRNYFPNVPGGSAWLASSVMNEIFARGGFLIWAGGVFALVTGTNSPWLKASVLSYWGLLLWVLLALLVALLFAPAITFPKIAGHDLDSSDFADARRQLEVSGAYRLIRTGASVITLGQVILTWLALRGSGILPADARTALLIALGLGVFLKILGLV
jgi:hypothetical protein